MSAFTIADVKHVGSVTPGELKSALKHNRSRLPAELEDEMVELLTDEVGLIDLESIRRMIGIYKYSPTNGDIYTGRGRSYDA
jgi:Ca2+-binding EF-hand superfamily protein